MLEKFFNYIVALIQHHEKINEEFKESCGVRIRSFLESLTYADDSKISTKDQIDILLEAKKTIESQLGYDIHSESFDDTEIFISSHPKPGANVLAPPTETITSYEQLSQLLNSSNLTETKKLKNKIRELVTSKEKILLLLRSPHSEVNVQLLIIALQLHFLNLNDLKILIDCGILAEFSINLHDLFEECRQDANEIKLYRICNSISIALRKLNQQVSNAWYYSHTLLSCVQQPANLTHLLSMSPKSFINLHRLLPEAVEESISSRDEIALLMNNNGDFFQKIVQGRFDRVLKTILDIMLLEDAISGQSHNWPAEFLKKYIHSLEDLILLTMKPNMVLNAYSNSKITSSLLEDKDIQQFITSDHDLLKLNLNNHHILKILINQPDLLRYFTAEVKKQVFANTLLFHLAPPHTRIQNCQDLKIPLPDIILTYKTEELAFLKKKQMVKNCIGEFIATTFLNYADYQHFTQFGPNGFYQTGRIQFANENKSGHYRTYASRGDELAQSLAIFAFERWQDALKKSALKKRFEWLEIGGGDGSLCAKIIKYIELRAANDIHWYIFKNHLQYTILDNAEGLLARQKETTQQAGNVCISYGDALNLKDSAYYKSGKRADLIISNELMDMFPSHKVSMNSSGEITEEWLIPCITEDKLNLFPLSETTKQNLIHKAKRNSQTLKELAPSLHINGLPLTKKQFFYLQCLYAVFTTTSNDIFTFVQIDIDVTNNENLTAYIRRHPLLIANLKPGLFKLIQPDLSHYIEGLNALSSQKSFGAFPITVTIDYGHNNKYIINEPPRAYAPGKSKYEIFSNPGYLDITCDVNFSNLVSECKLLGNKVTIIRQHLLAKATCGVNKTEYKRLASSILKHRGFFAAIIQPKSGQLPFDFHETKKTHDLSIMKERLNKIKSIFEEHSNQPTHP